MLVNRQNRFDGILLLSDIDGTLLNAIKEIPRRNIDAIRYFIQNGGRFSLATGRCSQSAKKFAEAATTNFPSVVLNGAAVYDFKNCCIVAQRLLPSDYKDSLEKLHKQFPDLGIQAYVGSEIYVPVLNDIIENQMEIEHLNYFKTSFDQLPDNANKILLGGTNERLHEMCEFLKKMSMAGMTGMFSETCYYELLPTHTHKGTGAQSVAEKYGIEPQNVVAVGDYFNDIDMLKSVAHPIVAGNAPDEVKQLAEYVTSDCEDGVVADTIEYIERLLIEKGHL